MITKKFLKTLPWGSAVYVVAHGLWAKKRGCGLSASYRVYDMGEGRTRLISNPREAFFIASGWMSKPEDTIKKYQKAKREVGHLMMELETLDFGDMSSVLGWMESMQRPFYGASKDCVPKILETFKDHGLTPGLDCGIDFGRDDPKKCLRWLVGQCLAGIETFGEVSQSLCILSYGEAASL